MTNDGLVPQNMPSSSKTSKFSFKNFITAYVGNPLKAVNPYASSSTQRDTKGKRKATDIEIDSSMPPPPVPERVTSSSCLREKTPERKLQLPITDTPMRGRLSEWSESRCRYTKAHRRAIIEYLGGEVRCGRMSYFFDYVLPPLRTEFKVDEILDYCIKSGILKKTVDTKQYYWEGFSQSPKDSSSHETIVYDDPFVNIFNAITKAARETSGAHIFPTTFLHADGNNAIWSERDSDIKPDAQLYLEDPDSTYPESLEGRHWYNAAMSFHFKKAKNGAHDNAQQVLHSLQHCMSIDPCRRFTLGASIENTSMRIWTYSRSVIIASDSFDFNSEPLTMIKVVLSLVFADKVDLGWDETFTARYDGCEREYTIETAGSHFRTTSSNIISDIKADGVYTAGTRIYKAFSVTDVAEKDPVIIKDYWPGEKYETEDVTRRKILDDIKDDEERTCVEGLILTPIMSGRVKVRGRDDHTRIVILRGVGPKSIIQIPLPGEEFGNKFNSTKTSEGYKKETDGECREKTLRLKANRNIAPVHRWHYRIVFKEVAIPYHKLRNLKDMAFVLICTVKALSFIHKAGWIHRDLSPGNLYLHVDPVTGIRRGLIGDLEFAKRVGTDGKCDVRTGTPDFTAIEVATRSYRFRPKLIDFTKIGKITDSVRAYPEKGVWANYMHDLESIWWIAVWTLFAFQKASDAESKSESYKDMIEDQKALFAQLFPGTMNSQYRASFFSEDTEFGDVIKRIPDGLSALSTVVQVIRDMLLAYYLAEGLKGINPIKLTDEGILHTRILEAFDYISKDDIHITPIHDGSTVSSKLPSTFKRITFPTRSDDRSVKKARMSRSGEDKHSKTSTCTQDGPKSREHGPCPGIDIDITIPVAQNKKASAVIQQSQSKDKQDGIDDRTSIPSRNPDDNAGPILGDDAQIEAEAAVVKSRSRNKRNKSKAESSSSGPVTRSRAKAAATINNEPAQGENRRMTRSMIKKAVGAIVNKDDPVPESSQGAPEARVTRSKSKPAARAPAVRVTRSKSVPAGKKSQKRK